MAICYFVRAALCHPAGGFLFCFFFAKTSLNPAFTVMQEHQQSAPRQDLPFPCPVSVNHTAKVCKPCFSLGTRKICLVLADKYEGAVCLKRGLGYQNLTECGYSEGKQREETLVPSFFAYLVFSSLVLSFSAFASAMSFCFHF